ncbi:MAG: carboxypeptidase M32 [Firmicutes bacterium]|nr:carboxypeptidase M32 [Bacillota bacterium]
MDLEQARVDFFNLQKKICAFNHAAELIYFDGETSAPPGTAANRARALDGINEIMSRLKNDPRTLELIEFLHQNSDWLSVKERRAVEFMIREGKRKNNIPPEEYGHYGALLSEARAAWHAARGANDFSILEPKLEQIVEKTREFAKYNMPDRDPYDYCIDQFEEAITVETFDQVFDAIKKEVPQLLQAISEKQKIDDTCLNGDFEDDDLQELALYVLDLIGIDLNKVGLSKAEHPFTISLGSHYDERIATRYDNHNVGATLYTILNQGGHALYEVGQADNLAYTVLDGAASLSLTESQGRFYENIIGRSRSFIEYIYPMLVELFPFPIGDYSPEELYRAVNKVEAGHIRINSDELTYNLHVMVRYELEKAMVRGDLLVKDLPDAWNKKYKEYLGIDVVDDLNGVLQDIHWPYGSFGYFPLYVLGNVFSAQITDKMNEEMNVYDCVEAGNFEEINSWNRDKIWRYGGLFNSKVIMERYVGTQISSDAYVNYLKKKYTDIYGL